MLRKSFVMAVHPEHREEYKRRHNPIPEDLHRALKEHGVHNYSIFLDPQTDQLFAYLEIEDEARFKKIAETEACRRWWASMRELMPSNPDHSPVSHDLAEVFHID